VNVKIIAGKFGSRSIKAPHGHATHPMSDRIKGSLFNSIGGVIEGAEVLDAFAGSGALGFESLSRGAKSVIFVDRDRDAVQTITDNIDLLGCSDVTKVTQSGVATWADTTDLRFDIIFADPPYGDPQFSTVSRLFRLLKLNGLMILSYPGRGEAPTGTNGVVVVDNRSYGTAALTFYRHIK
jgi:16S rRNA (guanine966-N2)-methyltransferase